MAAEGQMTGQTMDRLQGTGRKDHYFFLKVSNE